MNQVTVPSSVDHEEIRQYVHALSTSSDRSRYAIYAVMITSILIGIATWNVQSWGWPLRRIGTWYTYGRSVPNSALGQQASAHVYQQSARGEQNTLQDTIPLQLFGRDSVQLGTAREEYLKQFTSRSVFNSSPIPGVSIDINDLGMVGGISLILLMTILVFCLMREHENLHLAFYKVRELCSDETHASGNSAANFLYHALAMSQVITSPPTLARWHSRGVMHNLWMLFYAPFAVHMCVVATNFETSDVGSVYGANIFVLQGIELLFALILLGLCTISAVYSYASARRWESAFFYVNPGRRLAPQIPFVEWVKMPGWRHEERDRKRLRTTVIDTVQHGSTIADTRRGDVSVDRVVSEKGLSRGEFKELLNSIIDCGMKDVEELCPRCGLGRAAHSIRFTPTKNQIIDDHWEIRGSLTISCPVSMDTEDRVPSATEKASDQ